MSSRRTASLLLRLYPLAWRARYGDELESLILESSGGRVGWRVRLDVAAAALREHARVLVGRSGGGPREELASSLPAVLWAWLLVVAGGGIVGKATEHWRAATPAGERSLPSHAYELLAGGAIAGSAIVVAGAVLALPAAGSVLRGPARRSLLGPAAAAAAATVALVLATGGLAAWAHGLTASQRNGHDGLYSAAFAGWALLAVVTLGAWARLGARLVRLIDLGDVLLRVEALLAAAAAAAMAAVTAGGLLWWAAMAHAAPWFLSGGTAASHGTAVTPRFVVAAVLLLAGALLAAGAAARSVRAASALRPG